MNPESITVSLDLARQLKEAGLGFRHNGEKVISEDGEGLSYFCWWSNVDGSGSPSNPYTRAQGFTLLPMSENSHPFGEKYQAFTAEEILKKLPKTIDRFSLSCYWKDGLEPTVIYVNDFPSENPTMQEFSLDSLANAAAQMWLYLKKNNLIPPTL